MGVMRRLLLLPLLLAAAVSAQPAGVAALDAHLSATLAAWNAPGLAVSVVKDGEVIFIKGFGVRKLGGGPVTPETKYAIASTTKAFTTTAMAILADDGKMSWDDPVRKHLPTFRLSDPLADQHVTLRDLVSHRTGISRNDQLWLSTVLGREELMARIAFLPLARPFRALYQYQNILYMAAGEAVGKASGGTWEDFVHKRILAPLGMNGTDFSARDAYKAADLAMPYAKRDGQVREQEWRTYDNIGGAGAMNSTLADMTLWLRMQLAGGIFKDQRIVSAKNLRETHTPQMIMPLDEEWREANPESNMAAYGLGWIVQDYRGRHMVSHGGSLHGFRSIVAMLPNEGIGLVAWTNLGDSLLPPAIRNAVFDRLLGLPERDWNALFLALSAKREGVLAEARAKRAAERAKESRPSLPLAGYAGDYENPAYGTARVFLAGDSLALTWNRVAASLNHWHYDTFRSAEDRLGDDALATFVLGPEGKPVELRFLGQSFRRVEKREDAK
jgi:CubicO group peptidase (beta-lactamase class C family)